MGMHTIIIDLSCFFIARIFKAWEQAEERDFIPEDAAAMAIARITQEINPHADVVVAGQVMDPDAQVWQQKISPNYRPKTSSLDTRILHLGNAFSKTIDAMGIPIVNIPGYESDDVAAIIAGQMGGNAGRLTMVSNSSRLLTLLDQGIDISEPFGRRRTRNWCKKKYGIEPCQLPDFLALVGCSRFQGVPQVGVQRAKSVLHAWNDLETIVNLPDCHDQNINRIKKFAYLAITNKIMASLEWP